MAQKYLNTSQAAEKLGLTEADITRMRENRELYGYRDGADWKFKVEDIEKMASKAKPAKTSDAEDEDSDVLLSDVELGPSDAGASGTVIGMGKQGDALDGSDLHKPGKAAAKDAVSQFEELDLTLDDDLTLEDSAISTKGGGSGINLDDDDLVLGGSGSGSDITLGGDSGISLVDPADSGLSLEEPLDLGTGDESLELGEDDMIVLEDDAAAEMKGDDDFLLTPLDDEGDEDSESGSQVIALDTEGDESATMVASTSNASMAAMLDEDLGGGLGLDDAAMGLPLGGQAGSLSAGATLMQPAAALPEAPWSVWAVVVLALCVVVLVFCGMFSYDLMRNMWSWEGAYDVNSNLMDSILSMFES